MATVEFSKFAGIFSDVKNRDRSRRTKHNFRESLKLLWTHLKKSVSLRPFPKVPHFSFLKYKQETSNLVFLFVCLNINNCKNEVSVHGLPLWLSW